MPPRHRKLPPFAMEESNDWKDQSTMSNEDFVSTAKKNFEASRAAYVAQKSKARMATSVGISKGSGETPRISDEIQISPEEFAAQALANYKSSKVAYNSQLLKTRETTELARPPTASSRPATGSLKGDEFSKQATTNYLASKKAYFNQMAATRRATQFAGDPVSASSTPRMSDEDYASQSKANYAINKKAYIDMLERQ